MTHLEAARRFLEAKKRAQDAGGCGRSGLSGESPRIIPFRRPPTVEVSTPPWTPPPGHWGACRFVDHRPAPETSAEVGLRVGGMPEPWREAFLLRAHERYLRTGDRQGADVRTYLEMTRPSPSAVPL